MKLSKPQAPGRGGPDYPVNVPETSPITNPHCDRGAGGGAGSDCPVMTSSTISTTGRRCDRGAGRGDGSDCSVVTSSSTDRLCGRSASRGDGSDCSGMTSSTISTTGRRCDRGAGRGDGSDCSVMNSSSTGRRGDVLDRPEKIPPSHDHGGANFCGDPQGNTRDSAKHVKKEQQPCQHFLFGRDSSTYHSMKPTSLQRLVWLVLFVSVAPSINAQYTEMIAWISGSNLTSPAVGPGNSYPQGRRHFGSFYEPSLKLFHLFGGFNGGSVLNDLWSYNLTSDTWTLLSSAATVSGDNVGTYGGIGQDGSGFLPMSRYGMGNAYDPQSRCFFLFGGIGGGGFLRDLWRYNVIAKTWALLHGSSTINQFGNIPTSTTLYGTDGAYYPGGRYASTLAHDPQGQYLFLYSGDGYGRSTGPGALDDFWRFNLNSRQWAYLGGTIDSTTPAVYGTRGVPSSTNYPGVRTFACSFFDSNRRSFYLATGGGVNALVRYNLTDSRWTWISGSNVAAAAEFPALGVESQQPAPPARGSSGCLYNSSTSTLFLFNGDMWRLNLDSLNWAFIGGKTSTLSPTFGIRGVEATTNTMGYSHQGGGMFQDGNRIYVSFGQLGSFFYSAIMSSRIICPATQYWSNFLCYNCTGNMVTQVIEGRSSCVACPANMTCANGTFPCDPGFTPVGLSCSACGAGTYKNVFGSQACTTCPSNVAFCSNASFACNAGYFYDGTNCIACTGGTFKNVTGNDACTACPSGSFASGSGNQACTRCPSGTFVSVSGSQECSSCPGGSFANGTGNQACTNCPSGSFASGSGNQACTSCPSGSFAIGSGNQACISCPSGSFASGSGNQACSSCPSGSFASGSGNQGCTSCPSGSYSDDPGSSSCTACPHGATCDTSTFTCYPGFFKINSTHCADCPVNTFKEGAGNDACLTCPPNFVTCNSTALICNRGFERWGPVCLPCSDTPSTYKPFIGNHACLPCPAGATCNITDFTCLEGYYGTGSNCSACPVNMIKSVEGNELCTHCPIGASCADPTATFVCRMGYMKTGNNCTLVTGSFYKPNDGNVDPIQCPAGASCNATDFICGAGYFQSGSLCLPCDTNTFKSSAGNIASCLPCPDAATCTRTDFTCASGFYRTGSACSVCPANTFKPAPGNEDCVACPTNATCDSNTFTCDAGHFKNGTACSACQSGSYKSSSGNSECSSCPSNAICNPRLFTCNAGFFAAGSVCSPCASGYFKPEPSNDLCLMCPIDSTCNRTSYQCNAGYYPLAGGCFSCSGGFYKPAIGNKECLACPAHASCDAMSFSCSSGYFKNGSSCSPCQAGTYSDKIGALSCSMCPNNATCNSTSFSCQSGFYKRESTCTVCPQRTFQGDDGVCYDCPSNSLCGSDSFYCNPGFTQSRKECIPCAADTYKNFIGNNACLDCPSGAVCNGTHFTCAAGYQLLLGACTSCPGNTFKRSTGNTSCSACPAGATCSTTAITACPSGYQLGESDCQLASNDNNGASVSPFSPMVIAIIGGIGGLLCIAGMVIAIVVVRSRSQTKLAMEAKERAGRAESALAQMSINQLGTGFNGSLARGGTFNGFTQGGTFNPFAQGGTINGFTQGQTAITMPGAFPGSATLPSLARNSMTGATQFYGQQSAFGAAGSPFATGGQTFPTIFDQLGKTYVSQAPDFLEVVEDKDYRRTKMLAEGAMGEVWLCRVSQPAMIQRGDSYSCVAKIMKQHTKVPWEVFQQEITISHHIREHANIAKVIGFSRNPFAILLNYYPEGSLEGLIYDSQVRGFEWSIKWCRSLALDIGKGLSHMHKLSVAHCDIKPGNILLKSGNGSLNAVLSDFGISRILDDQASSSAVAGFKTQNLNGISFQYASPEAIMRFRSGGNPSVNQSPPVIKAGDVYSWAVVVCEMLTQKKPWSA